MSAACRRSSAARAKASAARNCQPCAVAARHEDGQAGDFDRQADRVGQFLADDVSGHPFRDDRRQARQIADRRCVVPRHLHSDRRQARRRDHRGARPVVGRIGGQRCHRPRARLGARYEWPLGDDERAVGRQLQHPGRDRLRRALHVRRRQVRSHQRPGDRRVLARQDGQHAEGAAGRARRRETPARPRAAPIEDHL